MKRVIHLKELRANVAHYANRIKRGESFVVMRRSEPLFRISPVDEGRWEEVIDFTKIRRGGIQIDDLIARL